MSPKGEHSVCALAGLSSSCFAPQARPHASGVGRQLHTSSQSLGFRIFRPMSLFTWMQRIAAGMDAPNHIPGLQQGQLIGPTPSSSVNEVICSVSSQAGGAASA